MSYLKDIRSNIRTQDFINGWHRFKMLILYEEITQSVDLSQDILVYQCSNKRRVELQNFLSIEFFHGLELFCAT